MLPRLLFTLTVALTLLFSVPVANSSAVLIADFTMSRMIELSARHPFCKVHKDRGDIQRMLLSADPRRIRQVPPESVLALESVCHDTGGLTGEFQGGLGFIYPGTKWCGPGNLATDFSDLGRYADEDRCCRDHDLCPNTLAPGECRRGLCNTGTFTRSHCDCDARFRRCLQALNTETANTLGAVFFNVVQVTCFRERSPCSVWQRLERNEDSKSTPCAYLFQLSDLYIPSEGHLIARIVNNSISANAKHKWVSKSLNINSDFGPSNFNDVTTRIVVKLASVGLIASSLFKEAISWPLNDFTSFLKRDRGRYQNNVLNSVQTYK